MKKLVLTVLGVCLFAPAALADNWGLGVKLGAAENDPKTLNKIYNDGAGFNREEDKNPAFFGIEALYEWDLQYEADKIGVKIGIDGYGDNEVKVAGNKWTESTFAVPFTVYYKRDNGIKAWSFFAGAGATWIKTEIEEKIVGWGDWKTNKNKLFPHIAVGAEYRFTRLFALGVDARYNFAAKIKKNGAVLSDRSGFGAAITGRFYF